MFLMGSFTEGMFKGAQSAMGIYTGVQGILAADEAATKSKEIEKARLQEIANQKGMTQADTAIGEAAAARTPPAEPAPPPAQVPGGDKPLGAVPASTTTPAPAPVATPGGITSAPSARERPTYDDQVATRRAIDAATLATRPGNSPPTVGGSDVASELGLSLPNAPPAPSTTPSALTQWPAPGVVPLSTAGRPAAPAAPATTGLPNMSTPMTNQPVGATVGAGGGPSAITNQPIGAGLGSALQWPSPGVVPLTGQPAAPAPPTSGGAPGTGGPTAPAPQAAISPAPTAGAGGVGSRFAGLLAQVNPIGTAHAEPTGAAAGDVNASQPGSTPHPPDTRGAVGGDQSMGVGGAPTSPIAGATIQDAPAPGQPGAPTPAQVTATPPPAVSAKPDPSGKVTPGPVQVKTAEGQTVTQSETPTISMAPPVSGWYGRELERVNPELAALAHRLVDQLGANAVTYDQVAAHMYRESKFQTGLIGPFGEHGVMQVMPDTGAWLERNILRRQVDHNSPEGSLTLGITYLRYLANDLHLGGNTLQTNLAYMRGPGGVRQVNQIGLEAAQRGEGNRNLRNALGWLDDMYRTNGPGSASAIKLDRNQFQGGALSENHVQVTPQGAMQAAASGPEGTLNYIASTGSPGLGMSELWIQYQGALERQAIWSGHLDMLPHIADFVLQQSHQGALANLAAADAALATGNVQGAASAIARAHAFFPDGSYAQIGHDQKGNLYGQQFGENTHQPLGKPIQITREMIQQQMMALGNPHDYVKTLDAHRKVNSDIEYQKAHGDYYRALPGIKAAEEAGRDARAADKAQSDLEKRDLIEKHKQEARETQEKNTNELDKELSGKYDIASKPENVSPQDWANRSEIERQIRLPNSMGGAHLGGATGAAIAEGMTSGAPGTPPAIRIVPAYADKEKTKQSGWAIVDKDGKVRAMLGLPAGQHILNLPGISARNPMNPPPNPQKQALNLVGAGMGSQQAQQQGLNQSLAGVPTRPFQQPQQTAIG